MYHIYSLCLSVLCLVAVVHSGQYANNAVIYTGSPLSLSGGVVISGPLFGNQNLSLTGGCNIGAATIAGDVRLDGGSVAGVVTASGSVTIVNGASATNVVPSAVTPTTLLGISTLQIPAGNAITDWQSITINPGCYDKFSIGYGGTITLTPGTYSFNSFSALDGSTVNIQSSSSTRTVVTVNGDLTLYNGVRITGDATRNVLLVTGNVTIQTEVNAAIIAPNGLVYIGYGGRVYGGIYANQVRLTDGDTVTRQTFSGYTISAGSTYTVSSLTRSVTHLSTTIPVTYYYPSNGASGQTFPVFVFHQGFNCTAPLYSSYASLVASYGYVVAVPNYLQTLTAVVGGNTVTFTVYFPTSQTINSVEDDIRNVGNLPANPDIVITGGHSQGGVSSLYALAPTCDTTVVCEGYTRRATLKGAVVFGTNNRNQSAGSPDQFVPVPADGRFVAYLQGARDGRALPSRTLGTFQVTTGTNKRSLISYTGMNHYGITNDAFPVGATPETSSETGNHAEGLQYLARDTHLSIRAFLNNDVEVTQYFLAGYRDDIKYSPNILIQHNCS